MFGALVLLALYAESCKVQGGNGYVATSPTVTTVADIYVSTTPHPATGSYYTPPATSGGGAGWTTDRGYRFV